MLIKKQIVCSLFQTERVFYIQFGTAKVSPVCLILQLAVILRTILAILKVHAVQGVATISDNNIEQWLPFSPIPPAQCCFAGSKKIERKIDIIGATLKEGKRGRAFF